MTNLVMKNLPCIICNKWCGSLSQPLANNDTTTGTESHTRFFRLLEKYLSDNDNDNRLGSEAFENITTNATTTCCSDCSRITESFCQLYHELEYTKLQLNWKVRTLSNLLSSAQKDKQSKIKRNWPESNMLKTDCFSLDELIELITDFKGELIKKCMMKLDKSFPRLELRRFKPTTAVTNTDNSITTYIISCEVKSEPEFIFPSVENEKPSKNHPEANSDFGSNDDYNDTIESFDEAFDNQAISMDESNKRPSKENCPSELTVVSHQKNEPNDETTEIGAGTHSSHIKTEKSFCSDDEENDTLNDSWGPDEANENASSSSHSESEEEIPAVLGPVKKVPPPVILSSFSNKIEKSKDFFNPESGLYKCTRCPKQFPAADGILRHFRKLHLHLRFQCLDCSKIFTERSAYSRHHKDVHLLKKSYQCPSCSQHFARCHHLAKHLKNPSNCKKGTGRHIRKDHTCEFCGKRFLELRYLRRHENRLHSKSVPQMPGKNDESCSNADANDILERDDHSGTVPNVVVENTSGTHSPIPESQLGTDKPMTTVQNSFPCGLCPGEFPTENELNSHCLREHAEQGTKCGLCQREFRQRSSYLRHYRIAHSGVGKRFYCDVCQHGFTRMQHLEKHRERNNCSGNQKEKYDFRKYSCTICRKRFFQLNHLKRHLRKVHSQNKIEVEQTIAELPQNSTNSISEKDEQPKQSPVESSISKKVQEAHLCSLCGKVFRRRDLLNSHMQIVHLKSARRTCDQCGKVFSCSANLRAHVKQIHLKLRKLVCEQCGKTFAISSQLKKHVDMMHLQLRVHECDVCGRMFKMKSTMLDHRRNIHINKK